MRLSRKDASMRNCLCLTIVVMFACGGCTYTTEVISEPPGARIEVDGDYRGDAPLTITWGSRTIRPAGLSVLHTVKAFPTYEGHYVQTKIIDEDHPFPKRMFFDMRLQPVTPQIDLNIRR